MAAVYFILIYLGFVLGFTDAIILGVHHIEDLDEYKKVYSKFDLVSDKAHQKLTAKEQRCYGDLKKCSENFKETQPVCAQHSKYGLVNFSNTCEIGFYNCMIKYNKSNTEIEDKSDFFYYNRKGKDCQYYLEKTPTIDDAVTLYVKGELLYIMKKYELST